MINTTLTKKRLLMAFFAIFFASAPLLYAQNGYIYVHKKASSELASTNFTFDLKQGATTVKSFSLNDQPDVLNAFDLGNSHGTGEGQLWAVISSGTTTENTHGVTGILYTRPASSQVWNITSVINSRSVDGIDANTAVYSNSAGNVLIYNGTTNASSLIWTPSNHGNVTLIDVASGGTIGSIVAAASDGKMYKYTGDGTTDTWSVFVNIPTTGGNIYRVDVNPTTSRVVYFRSGNTNVYTIPNVASSLASAIVTIAGPTGATSVSTAIQDIAISNEGLIFATYNNGTENVVYEYGTTWTNNTKSRGLSGLTAGVGNQAWGLAKVNTAQATAHSIFTRAVPGTTGNVAVADWIDDERVRTTVANGNSIMIPVPAGTYTLIENATTGWNNSGITLYDPTNNSTFNTATSTSMINVGSGEVVNVVYANAMQNSNTVPSVCGINYVVNFGAGTTPYGPAFNGFTSYHYRNAGIVGDGYYSLVKNSSEFYNVGTLTNHTPTNPLLPPNPVTNPPNPNGYFGMFNAAYATDDFFRQSVSGLVVGTTYEFAFWVADLSPGNAIRPNVTMGINNMTTGVLLNSVTTGDISSATWIQYTFNFVATSTTGEIFLKNNSIGGSGNDIAIDDITFAPAPPPIVASTVAGNVTQLCSNPSTQYQFSNAQMGGTWSTSTPTLISVNATTGLVTTVVGATGVAKIIYTYSSSSGCNSSTTFTINVGACVCYVDPVTGGVPSPTIHGITLLKRAGSANTEWPGVRTGAFTALESNSKGFVITRMTSESTQTAAANHISKITNPQEGMMVYDTFEKCLKIFDGSAWNCFKVPACP